MTLRCLVDAHAVVTGHIPGWRSAGAVRASPGTAQIGGRWVDRCQAASLEKSADRNVKVWFASASFHWVGFAILKLLSIPAASFVAASSSSS